MSITRILFAVASLVFMATVATEAPAGVLGDILSYVSDYPPDVQTPANYPQYNAAGGYQYQVTYHGPEANQPSPQATANQYGQYASASPAQGYPQYQQNMPQGTVLANSRGQASRTAPYQQPSPRRVAASRSRSTQQVQPRSRTTYRQASPAQQQVSRPAGNSWQPMPSYYSSYAPQQTQSTGASYFSSPYQYNNQGWSSGGFCPPGRS